MSTLSIGIFDSGLGGLTVVREISKLLPFENLVYFGDTGRVPYGTRSNQTIEKYARQDIDFLLTRQVKLIAAACGTVSSVAPHMGESLSIPYTGVVLPAAKAAAKATKNGRIGAIGTGATIKSHAYRQALTALNQNLTVFEQTCPLFVPLVENGHAEDEEIALPVVRRYLSPFLEQDIDTLILGCTHYPLLKKMIRLVLGNDICLIDTGEQAARQICTLLKEQNLLSPQTTPGKTEFFVSDTVTGFSDSASLFLGHDISSQVKQVAID